MAEPRYNRRYTITVTSPANDCYGDDDEPQSEHQSASLSELRPPHDPLDEGKPLERTESRLPSLEHVSQDKELLRRLGSTEANSDVLEFILCEDEAQCYGIVQDLIAKAKADVVWTKGIARDSFTLGAICQWIRGKMGELFYSSQSSTASSAHSVTKMSLDKVTLILSCVSESLSLLNHILTVCNDPSATHLLDAGLHDSLLCRMDQLTKTRAIILEESANQSVQLMPARISSILINLSTSPRNSEVLWHSGQMPAAFFSLIDACRGRSQFLFMLLHKISLALSDEALFEPFQEPELHQDMGLPLLLVRCFDVALSAGHAALGTADDDSGDDETWPVIFSCRFLSRTNGKFLKLILRDIMLNAGTSWHTRQSNEVKGNCLAEACAFDNAFQDLILYVIEVCEATLELDDVHALVASKDSCKTSNQTESTTESLLRLILYDSGIQQVLMYYIESYVTSVVAEESAQFNVEHKPQPVHGPAEWVTDDRTSAFTDDNLNHWTASRRKPSFSAILKLMNCAWARRSFCPPLPDGQEGTEQEFRLSCLTVLIDILIAANEAWIASGQPRRLDEGIGCSYESFCAYFNLADVCRLVGNLVHGSVPAQDFMNKQNGLKTLLSFARLDDSCPLMREAAIVAVRQTLEGHKENNAQFAELVASSNKEFPVC